MVDDATGHTSTSSLTDDRCGAIALTGPGGGQGDPQPLQPGPVTRHPGARRPSDRSGRPARPNAASFAGHADRGRLPESCRRSSGMVSAVRRRAPAAAASAPRRPRDVLPGGDQAVQRPRPLDRPGLPPSLPDADPGGATHRPLSGPPPRPPRLYGSDGAGGPRRPDPCSRRHTEQRRGDRSCPGDSRSRRPTRAGEPRPRGLCGRDCQRP
jgi:hypothetical protein